jgi:hypothetical protein
MPSFDEYTCCTLSLFQFCKVYHLVQRLADLHELRKSMTKNKAMSKVPETCGVCCHEEANVVLPCDHRVCDSCKEKWVQKHLACPFCRTQFSGKTTSNDVHKIGQQLPDLSPAELETDISKLVHQLRMFWVHAIYPNHEMSVDDILQGEQQIKTLPE